MAETPPIEQTTECTPQADRSERLRSRTDRAAFDRSESTDRAGPRTADDPLCVGVLSPHNSKETKAILNAVRGLGQEPVWLRDENVQSWIEDGDLRLRPRVDVLVNRLLVSKSDSRADDLQIAALYDQVAPVLNPPEAVFRSLHKYRAGAQLAAADFPIPDAFFGRSPRTVADWDEYLDGDAVHKRTIGTNGQDMTTVSPGSVVSPSIGGGQSFVQEFLDADTERPSDIRVYVVGDRIVGAMRRTAREGEWRANVALGATVEDVTDDLGTRPKSLAREVMAELGLDVAGVDLVPVDGEWYVLEVNVTAGFKGLFEATGVSAAPHIAALAIDRGGGDVDGSTVEELASTLDDSVPDCKPAAPDRGGGGILGYTNRVTVAGTDGAESAVAKADTGAERTSIDTALAGRIGLGPLEGTTRVRSAAGDGTETRPLTALDLRLNGRWRTVTASITDRTEMNYPVLLGRDVLSDYTLDIGRTVEE